MKKSILFSILGITTLLFSCKKDYNCTCTSTSNAPGYVAPAPTVTSIGKLSAADAKKTCETGNATASVLGMTFTSACVATAK